MGAERDELIGSVLAECTLIELLGRGGMGKVYKAQRLSDGATVVVKVMAPEIAGDMDLRKRLQREGQALAKLPPHPNVMQVYGVYAFAAEPCLVVEYVPGKSLGELLGGGLRFRPPRALSIALQIAQGMDMVHRQGLLHRDLKPDNVLLTKGGVAKIVDFGLAKDVFLTALTTDGQLLGTAAYLAPECWEGGQRASPGSDVFALGVTLYELLAGQRPYRAEGDLALLDEQISRGAYTPVSQLVRELSPQVDLLLLQMLTPEPRYRYAQMRDCADDIQRVLDGDPCRAPCLVDGAGRTLLLLPGKRFTIGSGPTCELRLEDPSVGEQQAQIRRGPRGFELRAFKGGSGVWVDGAPAQGRRVLATGQRLKISDVELVFREPRQEQRGEAFLVDVQRQIVPAAVAQTLAVGRDERAVLYLLERLDLGARRGLADLERVLGPGGAEPGKARLAAGAAGAKVWAQRQLGAISGQALGDDPAAWLGWWDASRLSAPPQLGPRPRDGLRLVVEGGPTLELGQLGVVLVGRDPKCHLVLPSPKVGRLHATLLRLHREWMVRDEGQPGGVRINGHAVGHGFLAPGDLLTLGDVRLAVQLWPNAPRVRAVRPIAPEAFAVLVELAHPATAAALVLSLDAAWRSEWVAARAGELFADPQGVELFARALQRELTQRAEVAAGALPRVLGGSAGLDAAGWRALLGARRERLPAQVSPDGWLDGALGT